MWPFGKSTKERLEDALKAQDLTSKLHLKVNVTDKTAVVSGEVPSEHYKDLIQSIATGINGIDKADLSGITVSSAGSQPAAAPPPEDPSAKAKAAYQKIKADTSLAGSPIDVLQKGSTVVLRGAVDSPEAASQAKKLAGSISGVTSVDASGLQVIENASKLNVTDGEGDVVYTVQRGDTLSGIALHYYGKADRSSYMRIAEANGLADANKIQVGQKLKIPGTVQGPDHKLA